ncbi:hypothetical protein CYMTET_6576 [Cymbomonas tetramitiformis]|uniref:Uncharacterized protein n=1 Tax=Cymbomonas tetramitiformis TaxID=36881 RepID=A0AAE0L6Y1_9CHLO|nr:hypothetical protein CYMTET_17633 [Cymbomonas tetramitiformis]KAK3285833.1 hypothetical protein CYMTET_6576 [Cymbomonas tetramitiformis]
MLKHCFQCAIGLFDRVGPLRAPFAELIPPLIAADLAALGTSGFLLADPATASGYSVPPAWDLIPDGPWPIESLDMLTAVLDVHALRLSAVLVACSAVHFGLDPLERLQASAFPLMPHFCPQLSVDDPPSLEGALHAPQLLHAFIFSVRVELARWRTFAAMIDLAFQSVDFASLGAPAGPLSQPAVRFAVSAGGGDPGSQGLPAPVVADLVAPVTPSVLEKHKQLETDIEAAVRGEAAPEGTAAIPGESLLIRLTLARPASGIPCFGSFNSASTSQEGSPFLLGHLSEWQMTALLEVPKTARALFFFQVLQLGETSVGALPPTCHGTDSPVPSDVVPSQAVSGRDPCSLNPGFAGGSRRPLFARCCLPFPSESVFLSDLSEAQGASIVGYLDHFLLVGSFEEIQESTWLLQIGSFDSHRTLLRISALLPLALVKLEAFALATDVHSPAALENKAVCIANATQSAF